VEAHLLECPACLRGYLALKREIETAQAGPAPAQAARDGCDGRWPRSSRSAGGGGAAGLVAPAAGLRIRGGLGGGGDAGGGLGARPAAPAARIAEEPAGQVQALERGK
jgi:hypothetical protein